MTGREGTSPPTLAAQLALLEALPDEWEHARSCEWGCEGDMADDLRAATRELHTAADALLDELGAVIGSAMGALRTEYADGWRDASSLAIAYLVERLGVPHVDR